MEDAQLYLVRTMADVEEFRRWLGERRDVLAFDTETGGLDWWSQPIRLVQFGDSHAGWAFPWDDWAGVAKEVLRDYEDAPLVAHNLKFDAHFLGANGAPVPRHKAHDSMLLAHLARPGRPAGLKPTAQALVHPEAGGGERALKQAMKKQKWGWGDVPVDFGPYWSYGALDTVLTARVWSELKKIGTARNLREAYELELAAAWVLHRMEENAARVDLAYTAGLAHRLELELQTLQSEIAARFDIEKPGSNRRIMDRLRGDGVVLTVPSETGKKRLEAGHDLREYDYSLDDEVLATLDHPLADLILRFRKTRFHLTTHARAIQSRAVGDLIHPNIHPVAAITGRMSVTGPPLQTIPRNALIRDCFIPRDGNLLALVDYDQIEMRLLAHFADERGMIDAIWRDVDLHNFACRMIYKIPDHVPDADVKKDPRRQVTKNANFAKAYVSGVTTFARTAGIPEAEADEFMKSYDAEFPGVRAFHRTVDDVARRRHATEGEAYVTSPIGRRHVTAPDTTYKLVNYLIQGTAAEVLKRALVDLEAAGYGDRMVLPVHDEIVFDVPAEDAEEVAREAARVMTDTERFAVPLTAGADVVTRWGDKYR